MIDCGPYVLSVIGGPETDPLRDPFIRRMEQLRNIFVPDSPSYGVNGDGIETWEVAVFDHESNPVEIPQWVQWYMPEPMSSDQYQIYGHVPAEEILALLRQHDADDHVFRLMMRP